MAAFALEAITAAGKTLIDLTDPERGYVQIRVRAGCTGTSSHAMNEQRWKEPRAFWS